MERVGLPADCARTPHICVRARIGGLMCAESDLHDLCDALDHTVGSATRGEIHRLGLIHRAIHVFVFNHRGEIFVQLRAISKDRFPGTLDSSAAGHVDLGESYREAAERELKEELGLVCNIREVCKTTACRVTDWEHVVLFDAVTDVAPVPDPDEIQSGRFMSRVDLDRLIQTSPEKFVPAFIHLWKTYWGLRR